MSSHTPRVATQLASVLAGLVKGCVAGCAANGRVQVPRGSVTKVLGALLRPLLNPGILVAAYWLLTTACIHNAQPVATSSTTESLRQLFVP